MKIVRMGKLLSLAPLLLSATMLHADIYTYKGNSFTFPGYALPPYTTSDFISGTFTTASPLLGGLTFGNNPGSCGNCSGNISPLVTSYSFFDGVNTWNPTNTETSGAYADEFYVSTDSQGNITDWSVVLRGKSGPFQFQPHVAELAICDFGGTCGPNTPPLDETQFLPTPNTFAAAVGYNPGTWTTSAASTPEPSSLLLLGTILVAGISWQAKRNSRRV